MIRAIVWKELREQSIIGTTLVVLGCGLLTAASMLADPPIASAAPADVVRFLGLGLLSTMMLAVTAGMVCGGAVFAAERESGTMLFLESLPVSRAGIWRAKLVAGLLLAVVEIGVLVATAAGLGLLPTAGWAFAVAVFALLAFVWGVFGSTTSRTTLGSVGLAIPAAVVTSIVVMFPIMLMSRNPVAIPPRPTDGLLFLGCMFVIPLVLSGWIFTQPDRLRTAEGELRGATHAADGTAPARGRGRAQVGLVALAWLTCRQLRGIGVVLSAFALVAGLSLLAPGMSPIIAWPGLALLAGVLAGVTAFADEQTRASARYWGEQRLPVGRAWAVKIGLHALLCLWLLVLLAAPLMVAAQLVGAQSDRGHSPLALVFRSALFDELQRDEYARQGWKYLLVPAVYGFVAGHLAGLVFRKLVVACGVAGMLGGAGAIAWGPSLLAGGVNHWQLWLPPMVALVTARLLMPAWSSDRLGTRRPLSTLAIGGLATVIVMIAGLGYRVLEVPNRADGEDDIVYVAGLPPIDSNETRREFRNASERYVRLGEAAYARAWGMPPQTNWREQTDQRMERIIRVGWPATDLPLATWLDAVFAPNAEPKESTLWHASAAAAASLPTSIYEYPQMVSLTTSRDAVFLSGQSMALALLVRGLQQQAAGNDAEFLVAFRTTLALARAMRHGSIVSGYRAADLVERTALAALDRWLDRLPARSELVRRAFAPFPAIPTAWLLAALDRPDLLRAAIEVLESADTEEPLNLVPHRLSERYVLREGQKVPSQWLPERLGKRDAATESTPEVDLVGMAWAVPWERERTRRLVGLGFEAGRLAEMRMLAGRPGVTYFSPRVLDSLTETDRTLRGLRRAGILKLALRLHRTEHGTYPDTLAELPTRGYLHRLPVDPHDETRSFGYRISQGETFRSPPRPIGDRQLVVPGGVAVQLTSDTNAERFVPQGQAIIWGVGVDGTDQGGKNLPLGSLSPMTTMQDLVYLVPHGPNP